MDSISRSEAFAQVFYKPTARQGSGDHAHMQRHLQPAVDRFKALEEDEEQRTAFRDRLSGYVKVYVPGVDAWVGFTEGDGRLTLHWTRVFEGTSTGTRVGE